MRRNWDDDDPFDIFDKIERMMNDMIGDSMGFQGNVRVDQGREDTHVAIHEYDDRITVVADIPDVKQEDINLHSDGQTLSIRASSETRSYNERVDLPSRVNKHSASATYNNGVLEITFDRADDSATIGGRNS